MLATRRLARGIINGALLLSTLLLSTLLLSLPLVTEKALLTPWQFKLTDLKNLEWFNNRKAFQGHTISFGISICPDGCQFP